MLRTVPNSARQSAQQIGVGVFILGVALGSVALTQFLLSPAGAGAAGLSGTMAAKYLEQVKSWLFPRGYVAPPGGGGVWNTINVNGHTVTFGHGARHIESFGLSIQQVERAIANHVTLLTLRPGANEILINVGNVIIKYRAFLLPNGTINVGTYFVIR